MRLCALYLCCTVLVLAAMAMEPASKPSPATPTIAIPAENEWRFLTFEQRHAEMTFLIHPLMMERY